MSLATAWNKKINWLREVSQQLLSVAAKKKKENSVSSRFLTSESKGKKITSVHICIQTITTCETADCSLITVDHRHDLIMGTNSVYHGYKE